MALTFKLFTDAALTTEQAGDLVATQAADGSSSPIVFSLYFGSLGSAGADTDDRKLEAESDPGVDDVLLQIVDSTPGVDHLPTEVKLALTAVGLSSATPGAPLVLGTTVLSGTLNALTIWIEVDDATGVVGTLADLSFDTVLVRETDV